MVQTNPGCGRKVGGEGEKEPMEGPGPQVDFIWGLYRAGCVSTKED